MADDPDTPDREPCPSAPSGIPDAGAVLLAFRRQFHLVRKVAGRVPTGSLSFNLHYEDGKATTKLDVPSQDRFNELAVVLRPLLDARSGINIWSVWDCLRGGADSARLTELTPAVELDLQALEKGPVKWQDGERTVSWHEVYDAVGRGDFFSEEEDAARFLTANNHPLPRPLLGFEFYSFHEAGLRVAARLFSILEDSHVLDQNREEEERGPCIFCRGTDGGFTAEEHVLPESLVGHDTTLPRGMVCDRCNHGPLSGADKGLAESALLALPRVLYLPHTKKGKAPAARLDGLSIEKPAPRRLRIREHGRRLKVSQDAETGRVDMRVTIRAKKDWVTLGRGLFKATLELVAFYQGRETVLEPRFDRARRFVLAGDAFPGYLLIEPKGVPEPQTQVTWQQTELGTAFHFSVFGLRIHFVIEDFRDPSLLEEAEALGLIVAPLSTPDSA